MLGQQGFDPRLVDMQPELLGSHRGQVRSRGLGLGAPRAGGSGEEALAVDELAAHVPGGGHGERGGRLERQADEEGGLHEAPGDGRQRRAAHAEPKVVVDALSLEAVVVGVQDAEQSGQPGSPRREIPHHDKGARGGPFSEDDFRERNEEEQGRRDVQEHEVPLADDGERGGAAGRSVGRQEQGQGDQEGGRGEGNPGAEAGGNHERRARTTLPRVSVRRKSRPW